MQRALNAEPLQELDAETVRVEVRIEATAVVAPRTTSHKQRFDSSGEAKHIQHIQRKYRNRKILVGEYRWPLGWPLCWNDCYAVGWEVGERPGGSNFAWKWILLTTQE